MQKGSNKGTGYINPAQLPHSPLRLKSLILDCNIKQAALAKAAGVDRTTINVCVNKNWFPLTMPGFKPAIEQYVATHTSTDIRFPSAPEWLKERGLTIADIWQHQSEQRHNVRPKNGERGPWQKAIIPGNPDANNEEEKEKQMRKFQIPQDVLKHFKIFKDPFKDDPRSEKEVFLSSDHRFLKYAMEDAANNGGLLAVIAEVGAGKTVMRREVIEKLKMDERVRIVFPVIIDKKRITGSSICDAIIMDLSEQTPKIKLESKSRQVKSILLERLKQNKKACLIIEEAQHLTIDALKQIKQFHELEEGRQKLISIILLGQPELAIKLDEEQHQDIRELSRRIQIAIIPGLGDNTYNYLKLKLSIVGADIANFITEDAVTRLTDRLLSFPDPVTKKRTSLAYPLTVNNYVTKAMITAVDMGEPIITADVIDAI